MLKTAAGLSGLSETAYTEIFDGTCHQIERHSIVRYYIMLGEDNPERITGRRNRSERRMVFL